MTLDFTLKAIEGSEFGVGRDAEDGKRTFAIVPVDGEVQQALGEMAAATWDALRSIASRPAAYEASEKYGSTEHVRLPIDDELAAEMRRLHTAENLPSRAGALSDPLSVFCYFARLRDAKGRRLTALRRATQFKGVLKSRLVRIIDDTLQLVPDTVFKLDTDFDLLIDDQAVHILRPSGFEFVSQLQDEILAAVPRNVRAIQADLPFLAFDHIEAYATTRPRAARYLASIRSQVKNVDKGALRRLCKENNIILKEIKGKLVVDDDHVMGLLEVLDRRRYCLELTGAPERFRAPSRRKIS
ncbi:MAG: Kiwa anti-phage protein KwaB-like domain-containing protein [Myxococcales bacterium]